MVFLLDRRDPVTAMVLSFLFARQAFRLSAPYRTATRSKAISAAMTSMTSSM
jgi:hypothetical protein